MGGRVFVLADGTKATVPDEALDKWMQRMDTRGVKFRDADMSAEMTVGEPEVIKAASEPEPQPEPQLEAAKDPNAQYEGSAWKMTNAEADAEKAHVLRMLQDPSYFTRQLAGAGGKYLGGMIGGAGPAAEGFLANAGRQAAAGAVESGGAAVAHEKGPWQTAQDVLFGGATAGVGAGLLDGLGRGAGQLARGAHWLGDKARNVVAGVGAREARAIAERQGLDAVDQLGRNLEELVPPRAMGRSSRGYAEELARQLGDEAKPAPGTMRAELRDIYQTAGKDEGLDAFVPGAQEQLRDRVSREAAQLGANGLTDEAAHRAAALQRIADRLQMQGDGPGTLAGFVGQKAELQAAGHGGAASTVPDQASAWAAARAGRIGKEELSAVMSAGATPETEAAWRAASDRMAKAATLEELTRNKAGAEITAGDVGTALLGGVVGAGAGYLGSQLTDADDSGAAMALGTGVGGAMFSGTRNAFRQAAGSWGSDVAANAFRGAGRRLAGTGEALRGAGQQAGAPLGALLGALRNQSIDDEETY